MAYNVLVVDDEINIRRLVQVNLEREGYIVSQAVNGQEALDKIQQDQPDLIVLDVMMPIMDGFDTLKALMADPKTENIPVIMLTAKAGDQDIFKGWASGVSAYLTKPFNPRELLMFVERVLQSIEEEKIDSSDVFEV